MFTKKSQADIKKSTLKIQDSKKDSVSRLRHLKTILGRYCKGENRGPLSTGPKNKTVLLAFVDE